MTPPYHRARYGVSQDEKKLSLQGSPAMERGRANLLVDTDDRRLPGVAQKSGLLALPATDYLPNNADGPYPPEPPGLPNCAA
jgi:hypothetical protein